MNDLEELRLGASGSPWKQNASAPTALEQFDFPALEQLLLEAVPDAITPRRAGLALRTR